MAYIILRPNSDGNPSSKFRLVPADEWVKFRSNIKKSYKFRKFNSYQEAVDAADGRIQKNQS